MPRTPSRGSQSDPAAAADASADPFVARARPGFLYVIYLMILGAVPVGAIAAVWPEAASAIAAGISAYFRAFPQELYTLFGAGYLGYTAARQWGKIAGSDR